MYALKYEEKLHNLTQHKMQFYVTFYTHVNCILFFIKDGI